MSINFLKKILISISAIIGIGVAGGFKICGYYCGENWCNGKSVPESECDTSVEPDKTVIKADECCRKHDKCCGHGDRKTCNNLLINCMQGKDNDDKDDRFSGAKGDPKGPLRDGLFGGSGGGAEPTTTRGDERIDSSVNINNRIDDIEEWFYVHFMDPVICGISINTTYVISDFFEAMNVVGTIFGQEICCGTVC